MAADKEKVKDKIKKEAILWKLLIDSKKRKIKILIPIVEEDVKKKASNQNLSHTQDKKK